MAISLIGLGSNVGDRVNYLSQAIAALRALPGTIFLHHSALVETLPVGGPVDQGRFLNATALLETNLSPPELLSALSRIEMHLGRVRAERLGPRTIDLDLLLYGDTVVETPDLIVPHPRMHERRFVLEPAAEIARDLRHPLLNQTIGQLLAAVPEEPRSEAGMKVVLSPPDMQAAALRLQSEGKRIGLVPTMGALHEGHLSLVRIARQQSDVVVATIFVNPTQFGPQEDFSKYPRTLESDLQALSRAGCDYVFVPDRQAMYPAGFSTYVEPPTVSQPLEGICRPGHFRGVATVVLKLFNLIPAHVACFGSKDYQQLQVIQYMARDLDLPIEIVPCPIVREPDGLAMSSRNRYLSPAEREQALTISRALAAAEQMVAEGEVDAEPIRARMRTMLMDAGIERIDYVELADAESLAPVAKVTKATVALVACFVGTTRLIDNRVLGLDLFPA